MKPKRWLLVLCAFALVATTPLQADSYRFIMGNNLVEYMRAHERAEAGKCSKEDDWKPFMYIGYIRAASEMFFSLRPISIPKGTTVEQCIAIVTKYLKEHPEKWHEYAVLLVIEALDEAFPKKDAK